MDHWSEILHKMNSVYKYQSCKKLFVTIKHKKVRAKAKIHQGQTVSFETVSKINDLYTDTVCITFQCTTFQTWLCSVRQHQRQLLSIQRRIDANKWKHTIPDIPEAEKSFRLYRDEHVVERKGILHKDINMWDLPSKRKNGKWE